MSPRQLHQWGHVRALDADRRGVKAGAPSSADLDALTVTLGRSPTVDEWRSVKNGWTEARQLLATRDRGGRMKSTARPDEETERRRVVKNIVEHMNKWR